LCGALAPRRAAAPAISCTIGPSAHRNRPTAAARCLTALPHYRITALHHRFARRTRRTVSRISRDDFQ